MDFFIEECFRFAIHQFRREDNGSSKIAPTAAKLGATSDSDEEAKQPQNGPVTNGHKKRSATA